jgi:hypothetical protein
MRKGFNMKLDPKLMEIAKSYVDGVRFRSHTQVIEVALLEFFKREEKEMRVSDISRALKAAAKIAKKRLDT